MNAATLVPHQTPFCFLDKVLYQQEGKLCCSAPVAQASSFLTPQGLGAHFGLEILAQTAAALFTLNAGDEAPLQGMLIACQNYTTEQAYYSKDYTLIAQVELLTPMPKVSGTLVKFSGELRQTSESISSLDQQVISSLPIISMASLSVYL